MLDNVAPALTDVRWRQVTMPLSAFVQLPALEVQQTVFVFARDAAGNVSGSAQASITLDLTAPGAPFLQVAGGSTAIGTTTAVPLSVFATGADEMAFAVNDAGLLATATRQPYAEHAMIDLGAVTGLVTVYAAFWDAAGNVSGTVSDTVTVDSSAPVFGATPIALAGGAAFTSSSSVSVVIDVDEGEQMQLTIDGSAGPWQPFSPQAVALLTPGDCAGGDVDCKEVCVTVRNEAGLEAGPSCATITLDTTPPSLPLIGTSSATLATPSATVALAAGSSDAFFDRYEYLLEAAGVTSWTTLAFVADEANVTLATSGSQGDPAADAQVNVVRLRAVDAAGNVSPESSVTLIVDETDPAPPSLLIPGPIDINAASYAMVFAPDNPSPSDATFSHYRVARELGAPSGNPTYIDTAQLDTIIFALDQGDGAAPCNAVPCENTLYVVAVDEAGRESTPTTLTVREDSTVPSRPELSPNEAQVTGTLARLEVRTASVDTGTGSLTYEVSGGALTEPRLQDGALTQLAVPLVRDADNEICVRALDDAGNAGAEDCVTISQESSVVFPAYADEVDTVDVWGDYWLMIEDISDVRLSSVRGGSWMLSEERFDGMLGFPGNGLIDGDGQIADVRLGGDDEHLWLLLVEYDPTNSGARDNFLHAAPIQLSDRRFAVSGELHFWDTLPTVGGDPGIVDGSTRADMDARGGALVAFVGTNSGPGGDDHQIQGVTNLKELAEGAAGAPDYTFVSTSGMTLCPGTRPRVRVLSSGVTWVAWCELDASGTFGRIMRNTIDGGAGNEVEIGTTQPMGEGSFDDLEDYSSPAIDEHGIWWVEVQSSGDLTGNLVLRPHDSLTPVTISSLIGSVVMLYDVEEDIVAYSGVEGLGGAESVPTFHWEFTVGDPQAGTRTQLSDAIVPTLGVASDGLRTLWGDRSSLAPTVTYRDRVEMTWVSHHASLTAFPLTDGTSMVWADARGGLGFNALLDLSNDQPDVVLPADVTNDTFGDDSIAFAAGRLVYPVARDPMAPTPVVDVVWLDIATGIRSWVSDNGSTARIRAVDVSTDGSEIAWEQAGTVYTAAWNGSSYNAPATLAVEIYDAGAMGLVPVDVNYAEGIEVEGDYVVLSANADVGGGNNDLFLCINRNGVDGGLDIIFSGDVMSTLSPRTFSLGRVDRPAPGTVWIAYDDDNYPTFGATVPYQRAAIFRELQCDLGVMPPDPEEIVLNAREAMSTYSSPVIGPTGMGTFLTDEGGGVLGVVDLMSGRRTTVLPLSFSVAQSRTVNSVGPGVAGYMSTELGSVDIWQLKLPR